MAPKPSPFDEQVALALQEPTLIEAIAFICLCEIDQIWRSARKNPDVSTYETTTTFRINAVVKAWIDADKDLAGFQPNFNPPHPGYH